MIFDLPAEPAWFRQAACQYADGEMFHPEKGGSTREAKRICNGVPGVLPGCPVQRQCLEYAIANDERFGVWGGKSAKERRRLQARRLAA